MMKRYGVEVNFNNTGVRIIESANGPYVCYDDPAILAAIEALEAVSKRRDGRWMPESVYDTVDRAISQLKGTA